MRIAGALVVVALMTGAARADYADDAAVGLQIAKGGFDRFRRSIAIGPEVGVFGGFDTGGHGAHGFSVGLAVYTFDVPVFDIQTIVADKIRIRVKERVQQIIASGGVPPGQLDELARQVAADVKAELLGQPTKQRTLEDPAWKVLIEYLRVGDANGVRAGISKGVKNISVGLGIGGLRAAGENTLIAGAEISLHLTPIGQARTPVLDLFIRGDLPLAGADSPLIFLGGARVLLDLL